MSILARAQIRNLKLVPSTVEGSQIRNLFQRVGFAAEARHEAVYIVAQGACADGAETIVFGEVFDRDDGSQGLSFDGEHEKCSIRLCSRRIGRRRRDGVSNERNQFSRLRTQLLIVSADLGEIIAGIVLRPELFGQGGSQIVKGRKTRIVCRGGFHQRT